MSEQPQGPGWWLASDGRYYPPQSHPQAAQQGQAPQYQAPQYPGAPQPGAPRSYPAPSGPSRPAGGSGCARAAVITLVVLLVLGVAAVVTVVYVLNRVGGKVKDAVGAGPCTIVTDNAAGDALGAPIQLRSGSGLGGVVSGVIDSRVLADAPSCWGATDGNGSSGLLVRVARSQGDGKGGFQAEVNKAKGVVVASSTDGQGGSTTVETSAYYGKAVTGIGDEAFCTTLGLTGTVGILVRDGDTLVYASVGGGTDGSDQPLVDEDAGCTRARTLAEKVLAG